MFDARAVADTSAIAFDGACLRGKCDADHELGYQLMRRFAGGRRSSACRRPGSSSSTSMAAVASAEPSVPMVPAPFRVRRPAPGHGRHLDARARGRRGARVRAGSVHDARPPAAPARSRSRSAATPTGRPARAHGARGRPRPRARSAPPSPGACSASAGRSARPWPVDDDRGRRRRDRRRRDRARAAAAGDPPAARAARALRPDSPCSTAAGRPTSCSTPTSSRGVGGRGRPSTPPAAGLARARRRRHEADRPRDLRPRAARRACSCGPEVMMRFAVAGARARAA